MYAFITIYDSYGQVRQDKVEIRPDINYNPRTGCTEYRFNYKYAEIGNMYEAEARVKGCK